MQRLRINDFIELFMWITVFTLPLLFVPSINLTFELSKVVFFRSMVWALTFLTAIKIIQEQKIIFPKFSKWIWMVFFGYFFVFGLAAIFSIAPQLSFWGSYFRQQGLFTVLHYGLFVLLLWLNYHDKHQWPRLFNVLSISVFVAAIVGILQKFVPQFSQFWIAEAMVGRVFSTLGHPNFFSTFLVMTIFLPLKTGNAKISVILKAIVTAASLIALYFAMSRGALFGLITGIFVFLIGTAIIQRKKIFLFASLGVLCTAIAGLMAVNAAWNTNMVQQNRFLHRFLINGAENRSLESRFELWNTVAKMTKDRPLLGYGPETLSIAIGPYFPKKLLILEDFNDIADRAHNNILDTLLTTGIFGLLAEIAIMVSLFFFLRQVFASVLTTKKYFTLALFSGLTALFIANLFGFSTTIIHVIFWLFFAATGFFATGKISECSLRLPLWLGAATMIVIGIMSATMIFFFTIQPLRADFHFRSAFETDGENGLMKATAENPHQSVYWYTYADFQIKMIEAADLGRFSQHKSYAFAEGALAHAGRFTNFHDGKYFFYHGRLNAIFKKPYENDFRRAQELMPHSPPLYLEWGKRLQNDGKHGEAIEKFEYYLSLAPPYWQWTLDPPQDLSDEDRNRARVFYKLNPNFNDIFALLVKSAKAIDDQERIKKYKKFAP